MGKGKKSNKTAIIKNNKGNKNSSKSDKSSVVKKRRSTPSSFPPNLLKDEKLNAFAASKVYSNVEVLYEGSVFVSSDFLDMKECQMWIDFCESVGMEKISHPATKWIAHRECGRLQLNDAMMADRLFARMEQNILPRITAQIDRSKKIGRRSKVYRPVGCNENLRLYKYQKNMSFGKHIDGSNRNQRLNGSTEITVLIYLSSCSGGATRFYPPIDGNRKSFAYNPQPGSILLHIHGDDCLLHEADPVQNGIKYVLRTDIVYA